MEGRGRTGWQVWGSHELGQHRGPGSRMGRQNGPKVALDVGRRLQLVSTWIYPILILFSSLLLCFFRFHLAFLVKLHAKKHCILMPVLRSLNSKPTFIPTLCPSLTSPERHRPDPLTLVWMSPNEDIYKYGHIRADHLAMPLGWLPSPQISGHGDRLGQPIIPPSPAPALTDTDALSNTTSGRGHGLSSVPFIKAKQSAKPASCCPSTCRSQGWQHQHARQSLFPKGLHLAHVPQQRCKGNEPV